MCCKNTSIPVPQYTSRCRHPRYPSMDDSAFDVDALAAVEIEPVVAPWTTSVPAALV